MKVIENSWTSIMVTIESPRELDLLLDALNLTAEVHRGTAKLVLPKIDLSLADELDRYRCLIAEAAGL